MHEPIYTTSIVTGPAADRWAFQRFYGHDERSLAIGETSDVYTFDTDTAPSEGAIARLAKDYPSLIFGLAYQDAHAGMQGCVVVRGADLRIKLDIPLEASFDKETLEFLKDDTKPDVYDQLETMMTELLRPADTQFVKRKTHPWCRWLASLVLPKQRT